ncbi:hypothetical protein CDCA_CDCA03G1104 [Cyanidium caldarium]|uniref:DUF1995 domain-containing protein n=1 Tax=Cyanidium caldarium TaxID=2771 RepID=A0AAV9IRZ9_CYACA|nr:hypothetical protein CDCA_CDCA03G1104 [Cyanidium caldarium]
MFVSLVARTSLPRSRDEMLSQAREAMRHAVEVKPHTPPHYEVSFPPTRDLGAALSMLMDANRDHARELVEPWARQWNRSVHLVFPDVSEARLACQAYGSRAPPCTITCLPVYERREMGASAPRLILVVQPGFNIEEWLQLEAPLLQYPQVPVVVLNGGMDRLRSNYYPPLFYPRLAAARKRYLEHFEPIYFLKPVPRGVLFRVYPEPWQTIALNDDPAGELLSEDDERPSYTQVQERLAEFSLRSG